MRFAAWRRGGNVLVIGQTLEGSALAAEAPFPKAIEFPDFMICR